MRTEGNFFQSIIVIVCLFVCLQPNAAEAEVPSDGDPTGILQTWTNADNELNEVYSRLLQEINDKDKMKLIQAQRLWIKMRDADCQWAAFPDNLTHCQIERSSGRATQLRKTLFRDRNGKSMRLDEYGQ